MSRETRILDGVAWLELRDIIRWPTWNFSREFLSDYLPIIFLICSTPLSTLHCFAILCVLPLDMSTPAASVIGLREHLHFLQICPSHLLDRLVSNRRLLEHLPVTFLDTLDKDNKTFLSMQPVGAHVPQRPSHWLYPSSSRDAVEKSCQLTKAGRIDPFPLGLEEARHRQLH
jgi:hypothetical protein